MNNRIYLPHVSISPDVESSTSVLSCLGTVDLDEVDGGIVGQQVGGGLGELGLQALTVAAPALEDEIKSEMHKCVAFEILHDSVKRISFIQFSHIIFYALSTVKDCSACFPKCI